MKKIYETFGRDIKREFNDVTTVDRKITALEIYEYVLTENVENIMGNFFAYFFDDDKLYPNLKMQTQLLQEKYRDKIGPGVWVRGFFGSGKSHFIKILNTMFTTEYLEYEDENKNKQKLNVIKTFQQQIRDSKLSELIGNINTNDYITFIFSANHITRPGDTILDCLPEAILRQNGKLDGFELKDKYSAIEVSEFLQNILKQSGKKRMIIFIDEILDVLDEADKVRKFEGLIELLDDRIWFVVTSLEAKTKLLNTQTAERMIHRFGQEQILYPEEMLKIVKHRYLDKKDEATSYIGEKIKLDKFKYLFSQAYLANTDDGKIEMPNLVISYPFYPFQLAYLKELLKNETKGSVRNLMQTVKAIIKNPEVCNKDIGYFVDINLIFDELKNKRGIDDEYGDLIKSLEGNVIIDEKNNYVNIQILVKILKAIVLLAQVRPEGSKASMILPLVYEENSIKDENILKDYIDILVKENYVNNEGGFYKPITKKESDVWSKIKGIKIITDSEIREALNKRIYELFNTQVKSSKNIIWGKINDFSKEVGFVLKKSDESIEYPNIFSCIPFDYEIEKLKENARNNANNKESIYIVPQKKYDGEALFNAMKFYLQMEEALGKELDFGIDQKLRVQIENKRDTTVGNDIEKMIEDCFKNSIIIYLGNENRDYNAPVIDRLNKEVEKMLKRKYSQFFGKILRESVDTFIKKEILAPTLKLTAQYLKDLDLVDINGNINTSNRYYNEFLKSFPQSGFGKDGNSIMDEFTKGKYGWHHDTIKILTALAYKNGDIKISQQGKYFNIPEDIDILVGSSGPFTSRERVKYDLYTFSRVNISDEDIRKAIINLKRLDPNLVIEIKLKDIADKIKKYFGENRKFALNQLINNYDAFINEELKNTILYIKNTINEFSSRDDAEEIVSLFNSKFNDDSILDNTKKVVSIIENIEKLEYIKKVYDMYLSDENSNSKIEIKDKGVKFINGDIKLYDEIMKDYTIKYQEAYKGYSKKYNETIKILKEIPEWSSLKDEQRIDILNSIQFKKIDAIILNGKLKIQELGTLEDIKRLTKQLDNILITLIEKIHEYNDKNKIVIKKEPETIYPASDFGNDKLYEKPQRVKRKFKNYTKEIVINIDSIEKLNELDAVYSKIKKQIEKELNEGKKITLEL